MSWTAFHSRGETLRAVIDTANAHQDGILPTQVPGVDENFHDELDLVGALLLKWHARLSGNIERALMREPLDLEAAVAAAWRMTASQMPGVRLVIDRCREWPESPEMAEAMERAQVREWIRLAQAAGLANDEGAGAVDAGRRVEERARVGRATGRVTVPSVDTPATPADSTNTQTIEQQEITMNKHIGDTPTPQTPTDATDTTDEASTDSFVERIKAVLAA